MKLLPLTSGILIGIFGVAATAIGIQYYNKCDKLHDDAAMKRNRNFLIAIMVMSILAMVGLGYLGFKKGKKIGNRFNAGPAPMVGGGNMMGPGNMVGGY